MKYLKNKGISFISGKSPRDVPKLKPNEIVFMPERNSMVSTDIIRPIINKNYKEWWTHNLDEDKNLKYCPGVRDVAEVGITIPLWADVRVRPRPDGNFFDAEFNITKSDPNSRAGVIEPFSFGQTGACPFTERREKSVQGANYLKLVSPWNVRTAKGYSVMITSSLVNPRPEFDVVTGVVNTDYYHTVNVVLNVLTDKPFYVAQGTPIAQLIIFKRKDNANSIIFGDEDLFHAHEGLGFGGPWVPGFKRTGKYRREQRKWDR
jgi:hypothetical protein